MNTTQVVLIKDASLFIGPNGELWASEDMQRYFPIDGIHYPINDDIVVVENILPFQITHEGTHQFYQFSNNAAEETTEPANKGVNYFELEDREDPEGFLEDISKPTGCLYVLFMLVIIVFTFLMTTKK